MQDIFYFGKLVGSYEGHHLYDKFLTWSYSNLPEDFPIRPECLDGGLLPPKLPQIEGRASLMHINAHAEHSRWTILAFWDRTADKRGNSNSVFVMRGIWDLGQAVDHAMKAFPTVWANIAFTVALDQGLPKP